jgi:hypothetical protein
VGDFAIVAWVMKRRLQRSVCWMTCSLPFLTTGIVDLLSRFHPPEEHQG